MLLLAFMREKHPTTHVNAMSGTSQIESAIHCIRRGAIDYVRKPCEPEELIKTVRSAALKVRLVRDKQSMLQQLEQAEQWHRLLVNTSPDVIYTLDADRLPMFYRPS